MAGLPTRFLTRFSALKRHVLGGLGGPRGPGDFVTIVSVVLLAWLAATAGIVSNSAAQPRSTENTQQRATGGEPSRVNGNAPQREETRHTDPGRHVPIPTASADGPAQQERTCLDAQRGFYAAFRCDEASYERWLFGANNVLRRATGAPLCWWHATVDDFRSLRGMGPSNAMLVVRLRDDAPLRPRTHPALHESLSAGRLRRIQHEMTEDCAMAPRW